MHPLEQENSRPLDRDNKYTEPHARDKTEREEVKEARSENEGDIEKRRKRINILIENVDGRTMNICLDREGQIVRSLLRMICDKTCIPAELDLTFICLI